jgi:hypothetical protein
LSAAIHVELSTLRRCHVPIEEVLLKIMARAGELSCLAGTWAVNDGLLASTGTVVGAVAQYLEGKGQRAGAAYHHMDAADQDILPGDYGGEIEIGR